MAERKIGADTFLCEPLNALDGFEIALRVANIAGHALPHVFDIIRGSFTRAGLTMLGAVLVRVNSRKRL